MSQSTYLTSQDIYRVRQQRRLDAKNNNANLMDSKLQELKESLQSRTSEVLQGLEQSIQLSFEQYLSGKNAKFDSSDDFTLYAQLRVENEWQMLQGVTFDMHLWPEIQAGLNDLLEKYGLSLEDEKHRAYKFPTTIDDVPVKQIGFIFYVKLA